MVENSKKHVLIIDGFPPPHNWLLDRDYRVTWLIPVDRIRERKGYSRIVGIPLDASIEEWINIACGINSIDPIHCIVNFSELHQDKTSLISEKLNLKWWDLATLNVVNNKLAMRNKIKDSGMHSIKYKLITNEETLIDIYHQWNTSIILKPLDSYGSKGIFQIHSIQDVSKAWNEICNLGFTTAIAEELISGEEYSVEAFSEDGQHNIIGITKKYKNPNFIEIGHCFPAVLDIKIEKNIIQYTRDILSCLGIKNGITHTEIIVSDSGPIIIETHLRLGGDYIPELVKQSFGIDMVDAWMNKIVNNISFNYQKPQNIDKYTAVWFKENNINGEIKNISNITELEKTEGIIKIELMKHLGDKIGVTKDSASRLALVIATANNSEDAVNIAKQAITKINFHIS